jgi:hypothetical protein
MVKLTYSTSRVLTLVGALVLAVCVLALMTEQKPADANSPGNFAVGSGINEAGEKFSFSAHEGPNGPSGYAKIEFPPSEGYPLGFRIQGHVSCFTVDGPNEVRFGFEIEKGTGSIPPGSKSFTTWVFDGGKGLDAMGTGFSPSVPSACPFQSGGTSIVKGDLRVHTAG